MWLICFLYNLFPLSGYFSVWRQQELRRTMNLASFSQSKSNNINLYTNLRMDTNSAVSENFPSSFFSFTLPGFYLFILCSLHKPLFNFARGFSHSSGMCILHAKSALKIPLQVNSQKFYLLQLDSNRNIRSILMQ